MIDTHHALDETWRAIKKLFALHYAARKARKRAAFSQTLLILASMETC